MSKAKENDSEIQQTAPANGDANARKKRDRDETQQVQKVRRQRVYAGPCQAVKAHTNTRVYKTDGRVRYCVCDECGHTWKQNGPKASDDDEER